MMTGYTHHLPTPPSSAGQSQPSSVIQNALVDISLTSPPAIFQQDYSSIPYFPRIQGNFGMPSPGSSTLAGSPTGSNNTVVDDTPRTDYQTRMIVRPTRPRGRSIRRPFYILVPSPIYRLQRRRRLSRKRERTSANITLLRPIVKFQTNNQLQAMSEQHHRVIDALTETDKFSEIKCDEDKHIKKTTLPAKKGQIIETNAKESIPVKMREIPDNNGDESSSRNHVDICQGTLHERQSKIDQIVEAFVSSVRNLRIDDIEGNNGQSTEPQDFHNGAGHSYIQDAAAMAVHKRTLSGRKTTVPSHHNVIDQGEQPCNLDTQANGESFCLRNTYFPDYNTATSLRLISSSYGGSVSSRHSISTGSLLSR